MATKSPKLLVIDACVLAGASGLDADSAFASNCAQFLESVYKVCHRTVVSEKIEIEWDNHQTDFSTKWRARMDRKSKLIEQDTSSEQSLTASVKSLKAQGGIQNALLKDIHIVDAAFFGNKHIVSGDEKLKRYLKLLAAHDSSIEELHWVHPHEEGETGRRWLNAGANPEDKRKIKP